MLRGRKDPLSGQPVRSIDHHQADKPTFKTYRPSGAAHSKSILVNPDTKSTLAIPHLNNRKFRKDHPLANDQAALDRLLAPQFQSGAVAEERKSFDHAFAAAAAGDGGGGGVGAGPSRMDRLGGRSGSVRTGTSDGTGTGDGHGPVGAGRKRLLSGRRHRDQQQQDSHGDGEEQLTSKALGVYIDKQGRLHDKEYDPFETVRSVSKKKFEGRSAFGAAREDDSEAGSDVSGSIGGGGGAGRNDGRFGLAARNAGILEAYGRAASDWQLASAGNPAFEARDRARVHDLQSRIRIEDSRGQVGDGYTARPSKSWKQGDDEDYHHAHEGDSNEDAMNRTVYSEYDSGVSATSPKVDDGRHPQAFGYGGSNAHLPPAFRVGRLQVDSRQPGSSSAASSSGSRSSPNPSNKKSNPSTSARTHASRLAQLEERPRSLLYPATPAQIAAQQEKEKARGKRGVHGDLSSDPDVFIPPIAPFNPAYHPARRRRHPASIPSPRSNVPSRAAGEATRAMMSYLPTRWARGDHEIRTNEEAIEKYRPLEWQGSQKAGVSGNGEPDWTPSCMDAIKRNWHEFSLSLRFGAHRTKKKLQRKVRNAM
ncbi:hypothetical protein QFC20_001154 [Naganishia adeliensis]|uniref:Uncharacterized protein n=1 Tax=Naganishia adeliensis TaxID=92952 RepID=A0ACC2WW69_9TREE|nr:hypothetical protein QFC20_001154 [Naganishia adeliensis]